MLKAELNEAIKVPQPHKFKTNKKAGSMNFGLKKFAIARRN